MLTVALLLKRQQKKEYQLIAVTSEKKKINQPLDTENK